MQHDELAVADDLGLGGAHLLKGRESLLALRLLDDAEGGVDDDDGHDDDDVGEVDLALNGAGDGADDGRDDQHDDHRVGHLLEEADPQRSLLGLLKLVRAELLLPARGLGGAQARLGVGALLTQDILG